MPDPLLVQTAIDAANTYGIPQDLFLAQINQESGFNVNPSTGVPGGGIAQFIPQTAQQYGITDRGDPVQSLYAAAHYDSDLYKQTGSWTQAMQSYGTTASGNGPQVATLAGQLDASGVGLGTPSGQQPPLTLAGSNPAGGGVTPQQQAQSCFGGTGIVAVILDFFVRAVVIILGIVMIWEGLRMMGGQSSVTIDLVKAGGKKIGAVKA